MKKGDDKILQMLSEKLSLDNICKQFSVTSNLNANLEIKLSTLQKIYHIGEDKKDNMIAAIQKISFLKYQSKFNKFGDIIETVKFQYPNSKNIVFVTGLSQKWIDSNLEQFNRQHLYFLNKPLKASKSKLSNFYWFAIDGSSQQGAIQLQKFLRRRKALQAQTISAYRIEKRRVRIVIMAEELYSLLIEAMCLIKSNDFLKSIQNLQRKKEQKQIKQKTQGVIYRPMFENHIYMNTNNLNIETQEQEDCFSESTSLNSDLLDQAKLKDLIETSQQGIQAEHNIQLSHNNIKNTSQEGYWENSLQLAEKVGQELPEEVKQIQQIEQNQKQTAQNLLKQQIKQQLSNNQQKRNNVETNDENIDTETIQNKIIQQPIKTYADNPSQTQQNLYSILKFSTMKKWLKQFENKKNHFHLLIEIPKYLRAQTDEQKNRHLFYTSLCKKKIGHRRDDSN